MTAMSAPNRRRGVAASSIAAVAVIALCAACAPQGKDDQATAKYCAIMPDAVGLYTGNEVTQMGVRIGEVTAITSEIVSTRVDFTVEGRVLPDDVKAAIRSASIVADRSLELVGNYDSGPELSAGECVPLGRTFTPKSLSQVVGSAADFINAINPKDSTNMGDFVTGIDKSLRDQGAGINQLLTTTSTVVDSPDQAIGDISTITKNLALLTSTIRAIDPTIEQVLTDALKLAPDISEMVLGADYIIQGVPPVVIMVGEIERELGGEIQQVLDVVSVAVRKLAARAPFYASLLNVTPRLINGIANFVQTRGNTGSAAFTVRYRPPLYRVRTPNGAFQCGYMNAAMPGSCANVNGTPYAVDVALLQYVLTLAANR
jgi:virulence factor Mce-like protein